MFNTVAGYLQRDFPKKMYFYWKNKIKTKKYDFLNNEITKEEFIEKYLESDLKKYDDLTIWETGESYANIKKVYYTQIKTQDFVQMFESVREKALAGDNASIKTFMMLQKEIDKGKKHKKDNENEDDGLEV